MASRRAASATAIAPTSGHGCGPVTAGSAARTTPEATPATAAMSTANAAVATTARRSSHSLARPAAATTRSVKRHTASRYRSGSAHAKNGARPVSTIWVMSLANTRPRDVRASPPVKQAPESGAVSRPIAQSADPAGPVETSGPGATTAGASENATRRLRAKTQYATPPTISETSASSSPAAA